MPAEGPHSEDDVGFEQAGRLAKQQLGEVETSPASTMQSFSETAKSRRVRCDTGMPGRRNVSAGREFSHISWRLAGASAGVAVLGGCSAAPSQDIMGSFFPSWMLCAALGVAAAILLRQIFVLVGLGEVILLPLLTYAALAAAAGMLVWLIWFGH